MEVRRHRAHASATRRRSPRPSSRADSGPGRPKCFAPAVRIAWAKYLVWSLPCGLAASFRFGGGRSSSARSLSIRASALSRNASVPQYQPRRRVLCNDCPLISATPTPDPYSRRSMFRRNGTGATRQRLRPLNGGRARNPVSMRPKSRSTTGGCWCSTPTIQCPRRSGRSTWPTESLRRKPRTPSACLFPV